MKHRAVFLFAALGLTLFAGATAQQKTAGNRYDDKRGYDEDVALRGKTTISTGRGPKTLNVVVSTIIVAGGREVVVALPEKGFAVFQHRGGEVEMRINDTRRTPLEGEWVSVPLPAKVVLATKGDTADLDLIILGE